jgi:protoporphyrinogen/coproporphyrinogen III oxidase
MHDIVVIGAGISGLAAAWELQARGLRPLVLEQRERPGGVIHTEIVDDCVIDGGPDALLIQKPAAIELCRALGIADRLLPTQPPRTAFVLCDRRLVPLPDASFLGLPTRIRPFLTTRLFSWRAKLRMAAEPLLAIRTDEGDESIGAFVRRRFGNEAVARLAEPLLAGIHVGDVERLSVRALFPRLVEAERAGGVLRTLARSSQSGPRPAPSAFMSFPRGIGELVDALVREVGDAAIRHGARVTRIEGRQPFTVTFDSGDSLVARSVILAVPAWAAASALPPVDLDLARLCADIPYASSATVVLGFDRHDVRHPLAGSGFVVPRSEGLELTAATFVTSKWPHRSPPGMVLLRGFLGGANREAILAGSDADLTRVILGELSPILDIRAEPRLARVYHWTRATPQYIVGHLARVRAIDERLSRIPGLYLTGSGYRGTGIPDCVADARRVAVMAAGGLGALR